VAHRPTTQDSLGWWWVREGGGSGWAGGGFQPIWLREENFLFYKSFFFINRNQFEFKINLNSERLIFTKQNVVVYISTKENMRWHECDKQLLIYVNNF
jgi:hypothetical protein